MSRSVLVIVIVVLVLAIAGVGLALFWQPNILNRNGVATNTTNATNTPAANANLGASNLNADLQFQAEVLEQREVDQTVSYREQQVPVDRVELTDGLSYNGPAPDGKKYVIVHFSNAVDQFSAEVETWLGAEIQLVDGDGNATAYEMAVFAPALDQRFISFLVENDASGFSLRFVRDGEDRSVDLGI